MTASEAEDLRRRIVRRSCMDTDDGTPECMGAAGRGPERCTCGTLTPGEHDEAVCVAWAHYHERRGRACHDCAFRRGSPEDDDGTADKVLREGEPFYCHQGMPIDGRGGVELGNFAPDDCERYPVCSGWLAKGRRL